MQLSGRWECRTFPLSCLAVCLCSALHASPRDQVLSGGDIATYGSICALASFSRKELKESLLNNVEFKKLADTHAPQWKTIVQQFYNSNYAKVFEMLEAIKVRAGGRGRTTARAARAWRPPADSISPLMSHVAPLCCLFLICQNDLYLDLFLSSHVNRLIRQIRERAFIQYFKSVKQRHTRRASFGSDLLIPFAMTTHVRVFCFSFFVCVCFCFLPGRTCPCPCLRCRRPSTSTWCSWSARWPS